MRCAARLFHSLRAALGSLLLGAACFATAPAPATAQEWPTRTVQMVVPFAPGGSNDVIARRLSERLSRLLAATKKRGYSARSRLVVREAALG